MLFDTVILSFHNANRMTYAAEAQELGLTPASSQGQSSRGVCPHVFRMLFGVVSL